LRLTLPYAPGNRAWIKEVCGEMTRPVWNGRDKVWEIARSHYWILVEACALRFGSVLVVEDYATQEKCTVACTNAKPETVVDCTCVCGGDQHGENRGGSLRDGWILVGEGLLLNTEYMQRAFRVQAELFLI
jgi:hypothetical protein